MPHAGTPCLCPRPGETYTVGVPGEQYWQDGRIRVDSDGYEAYYDAVDSCSVSQSVMMVKIMTMMMVINALIHGQIHFSRPFHFSLFFFI